MRLREGGVTGRVRRCKIDRKTDAVGVTGGFSQRSDLPGAIKPQTIRVDIYKIKTQDKFDSRKF